MILPAQRMVCILYNPPFSTDEVVDVSALSTLSRRVLDVTPCHLALKSFHRSALLYFPYLFVHLVFHISVCGGLKAGVEPAKLHRYLLMLSSKGRAPSSRLFSRVDN